MPIVEAELVPHEPQIQFGELRPDLFPGAEIVNKATIDTTSLVAMVAKVEIENLPPVPEGVKLTGPEKDSRIKVIDNTGAAVIRYSTSVNDYGTDYVGAEGGKEKQEHKGGLDIDVVLGKHGNGYKLVWAVHDVIEGTTAVAHNKPGAISIIATTTAGGIIPTPTQRNESGKKVEYMEKLMGPRDLVGKIALDKSPEENLQAAVEYMGVKPEDIEVTVLKRDRNIPLIERIEKFGAKVNRIEAGDLAPALNAMRKIDGKARFVMGIGGWEEGVIAACAAKALGAVAEGRMAEVWKEDGVEHHKIYPEYLRLNDIVPGEKEHCAVTFTAITDLDAFDLKGVDLKKGEAQGMQIDHEGFHKKIIRFDPEDARRAHEKFRVAA